MHGYRNHLLLEVKTLSYDLQSKGILLLLLLLLLWLLLLGGPISISQEVSGPFNLISGRETCIRRVDKELVALDLVEFRFKVCVYN